MRISSSNQIGSYVFGAFTLALLGLPGCEVAKYYHIEQRDLHTAQTLASEQQRHAAVAARAESNDQRVWVRADLISETEPSFAGLARVKATYHDSLTPTGGVLLGLGIPIILGGAAAIVTRGGDNAGWSVAGGTIAIGAGGLHMILGATFIAVGMTRRNRIEVGSTKRGWTYIPSN